MNIFLIDADNLNSGAWVDEAFRVLQESEGALPVRRANGSAENLKGLADVFSPMQHVDVAAILQAVPALPNGQPQSLGAVARALLDAKPRDKNLTSIKLFKKFPNDFALLPPEKPRSVQYTPAPDPT